jgi:uncharacterized protein YhfF/ribosomal protein S18 acetylase RimI-like enzyme
MKITIDEVPAGRIPYELLFLADEDDLQIAKYKSQARFWGALYEGRIIGQIGLLPVGEGAEEIPCLSVEPEFEGKRIGTDLIETVLADCRERSCRRVLIKTGNCGLAQIALYQRCGFRIVAVNRDYFLKYYGNPIYEGGIRCRDQIVMEYEIFGKEEIAAAVEACWSRFLRSRDGYEGRPYTVWQFGLGERMGNNLVGQVITGKKRATTSALDLYEEDEALPAEGDLSIVTYGNGMPACIIETLEIRRKTFREITEEEAGIEGEGDGSLEYWRNGHRYFFEREYKEQGKTFSGDIPVIFEIFNVIYNVDCTGIAGGEL